MNNSGASESLLVGLLSDSHRKTEKEIIGQLSEFVSAGLISRADVNLPNRHGDTPLALAVKHNYATIAKYLLVNGAEPGNKALYYAYEGGSIGLTELLLVAGADVNARYEYGNTLLHKAVIEDATDFIDLFLRAGADVDVRNTTDGQETPYNIAERKGAAAIYAKLRAHSKFKFDKAYLLLGHGSEAAIKFEERVIVPRGVIIVHQTTCGLPIDSTYTCSKLFAFMNRNNHVLDPVRYKAELEAAFGTGLRIYVAGMRMPPLDIQLLNTHNMGIETEGIVGYTIVKSGVYKYPLTLDAIKMSGISGDVINLGSDCAIEGDIYDIVLPLEYDVGAQKKILKDAYRGSIFPGEAAVGAIAGADIPKIIMGENNTSALSRVYTMGELIDRLGAGVYYLNTCRSIMGEVPASFNIGAVGAASQEQHERAVRRGYLTNSAWALERRKASARRSRRKTLKSQLRGSTAKRLNRRQEKRRTFKATVAQVNKN